MADGDEDPAAVRIDKWLWAARFYKTRSLAQDMVARGRVRVDGEPVKPSRALRPGAVLDLPQGRLRRRVEVVALSDRRGGAPEAALLYRDLDPPRAAGLWDDD